MSHCARCDWAGDDRDQLVAHAFDSEHWLCHCGRSLTDTEPATCEQCLTQARSDLAGVVVMFEQLPPLLGILRARKGGGTRTSHETPLLGGAVLSMLASGSEGGTARRLTTTEQQQSERWWLKYGVGPLSLPEVMRVERERTGREHQADNLPTDPQAVSQQLGSWVLDWQDTRDQPEQIGHTPSQIVSYAARYLQVHARWAANSHAAFAEFCRDMRDLHARLEHALDLNVSPARAPVKCFDCGGTLVEVLREVTVTQEHQGRRVTRTGPVHSEDDGYCCRTCEQTYPPGQYNLALAAAWEAAVGWVPLTDAARRSGRSVETVETWAKRGEVQTMKRREDGRKLVWWPDLQARIRRTA